MRQARKRSVTVILAQRENPLIEISAVLTQCDRALNGDIIFCRAKHKELTVPRAQTSESQNETNRVELSTCTNAILQISVL